MKNIVPFIIFLIIFFGVIAFMIVSYFRKKEEVFQGVVIDKNINEVQHMNNGGPHMTAGMSGGVTHQYMIKVKTDNGKEIKYQISEGKYEIVKIGDRVSKAKGTTDIDISSSSQTTSPTTPVNYTQGSPDLAQSAPIPPIQPVTINPTATSPAPTVQGQTSPDSSQTIPPKQ